MKKTQFGKAIAFVLAGVMSISLFAGCSSTPSGEKDSPSDTTQQSESSQQSSETQANEESLSGETVKIGIFVPLSGTMADKGRRIVDGITMAKDEINEAGGISGAQIELIIEDDEGVAATSISAVTKLINSDEVHAVMGSNPSPCTIAAMTVTETNEIPHIAANSSSPKITASSLSYVFQTIPNDAIQAANLIAYAKEDLKIEKYAIMRPNDDYGMGGAEGALNKLSEYGYDNVMVESYNPGDKDFTAQVNKIKEDDPGAIIIWGKAAEAALFISQYKQQVKSDVVFLGAGGIPRETFVSLGGDYVEGTYVTNTFVSDSSDADFMTKFEDLYGYEPDLTSAQAYDGAHMLFDSIARANSLEGPAIRDAIEAADWEGVTGIIKFAEDHSVPDKKVYITQLSNGEWNKVK